MPLSFRPSTELRQLALRLREAPRRIQELAARRLRTAVLDLIEEGFQSKTDPYGTAWKPPKDGGPTMDRTGKLRRGFDVEVVPSASGAGLSLRITNSQAYAKWLQRGGAHLEPRRMVPDARTADRWRRRFDEVYAAALDEWYRSVRV